MYPIRLKIMYRKTVVITGAGGGIGRAMAIGLSNEGYNCILIGRNPVSLQKTLINLEEGEHEILAVDVTSRQALENAVLKIRKPVDALVANAGIGGENHWNKNDRWDEIIQTNLTGTYNFVNAFLPLLKNVSGSPGYKHIVITSSVLARLGVANYTAYCASKAGLLGLMRSWAIELAPLNILVNAVCPGWVNTQMSKEGMLGIAENLNVSLDDFYGMAMQDVPLRKMSEPHEIADLLIYLLKQTSITGQAIDINNGSVMNS